MFFKRFIFNTIGGIILFNCLMLIGAGVTHTAFQFNCFYGLSLPILFGWISAMLPGTKEQI